MLPVLRQESATVLWVFSKVLGGGGFLFCSVKLELLVAV